MHKNPRVPKLMQMVADDVMEEKYGWKIGADETNLDKRPKHIRPWYLRLRILQLAQWHVYAMRSEAYRRYRDDCDADRLGERTTLVRQHARTYVTMAIRTLRHKIN
jgi:hypothetical protein